MTEVDDLIARPKAYYNIDGVGELGVGFMMLAYALLGWLQMNTPKESIWHQMYMLFIYVGVMCSIIHYGSKAIKNRITYPRTGFVQYRKRGSVWAMIVAAAVATATAWLVWVFRPHGLTTLASLVGLLLAASYAYGIARTVPWKWTVVCAMALGSFAIGALPARLVEAPAQRSWLTAVFPADALGAFWLTFVVYGILLLISGGVSLRLYIRHTKPPEEDAQ